MCNGISISVISKRGQRLSLINGQLSNGSVFALYLNDAAFTEL